MADPAVEDYFAAPANQRLLDTAALIVALVNGRESATRTDYAHPKLREIVRLLEAEKGTDTIFR